MKVKTRLRINAVLSVVTALFIGLLLYWATQELNQEREKRQSFQGIVRETSELRNLLFEFFIFHEERMVSQWEIKGKLLTTHLKGLEVEQTEQKIILDDIKNNWEFIKKIFSQLVSIDEKQKAINKQRPLILMQGGGEILTGQLLLRSQDIVSNALQLANESQKRIVAAQKTFSMLLIGLMGILVMVIVATSFSINKHLVKKMDQLRAGTEIIGSGDLNYRIGIETEDEIGQLSQAFDQMSINLKMASDQRKKAEEALQKAYEGLEIRVQERTVELTRSNAELAQFAYVASHDLQEPLRMVASYVQLLARRYQGKLDAEADEFIDFAVDGANRMQRLIQDLLTYSRVGTRGKEFGPVSCEEILEQSLTNLQTAIQESGAEITHEALPTVMADDSQLVQLLQNLIGNAIKFQGSEVTIQEKIQCLRSAEWNEGKLEPANGSFPYGIMASALPRIILSEFLLFFSVFMGREIIRAPAWGWRFAKKLSNAMEGGSGWNQRPVKVPYFILPSPTREAFPSN